MFPTKDILMAEAQTLEPPEQDLHIRAHCGCCGEPIYSGNRYYQVDDEYFCFDCVTEGRFG